MLSLGLARRFTISIRVAGDCTISIREAGDCTIGIRVAGNSTCRIAQAAVGHCLPLVMSWTLQRATFESNTVYCVKDLVLGDTHKVITLGLGVCTHCVL